MNIAAIVLDLKAPKDWELRPAFVPQITASVSDLDRIAGKYDLPRPLAGSSHDAGKVRCGLNGCDEPHFRGFLILLKDGRETIIGRDCGERKFGVAFDEIVATFAALETNAARKKLLSDLQMTRDEILGRAQALLPQCIEAHKRIDAIRVDLKKFVAFWNKLYDVQRQDGRVLIAAEKSVMSERKDKTDLVLGARIEHCQLFFEDTSEHHRSLQFKVIHWLQSDLDTELALAGEETKKIEKLAKQAAQLHDILRDAKEFIEAAKKLLAKTNLSGFDVIEAQQLSNSQRSSALTRALHRVAVSSQSEAGLRS